MAANGHRAAATPGEAASGADFVMMCVGNDDDVRSVVYGADGALAGCGRSGARRPHHGVGRTVARELAAAAEAVGVGFVDGPVSGGQAGAENGQLTVMCGADDAAVFEAANR